MGFGTRLLVHFFALIVALFVASPIASAEAGIAGSMGFKFAAYIGLVCLVPRGLGNRADWLVPTGSGFLLVLLWSLWGIPFQYSIIWGGAATWLIRLALRKGQFDWEMTALPWLVVALFSSYSQQLPAIGASAPLWFFVVIVAAGYAATVLYGRYRGNNAQRAMLQEVCDNIDKKAGTKLPQQLEKSALEFSRKGRRLLRLCPRFGTDTAALVERSSRVGAQLDHMIGQPSESALQKLAAAFEELNAEAETLLRAIEEKAAAASPQAAMDRALAERTEAFRASASDLQAKARSLPGKVKGYADGIALATDKVIICMRDDPNDVALGDRFLSRYLKAAHSVLDDYARLSAQGGEHTSVSETLAKSEALLERLQKAFEAEHARLLQNDTVNLTAELNVLDKLLKMDGR